MTENMPSSVRFGSRPRSVTMRAYSSRVSPWAAMTSASADMGAYYRPAARCRLGSIRLIDHDGLFKKLLSTFFLDFLELFCADLANEIEPGSLQLLPQELLPDLARGRRRVADLVARVRLRGHAADVVIL